MLRLRLSVRTVHTLLLSFWRAVRIFAHSCVKIATFGKNCAHSAVELLEGSKNFCTQFCWAFGFLKNRGRKLRTFLTGLNEITCLCLPLNRVAFGSRPKDRFWKVCVLRCGLHGTWLVEWGRNEDSSLHNVEKSYKLENQIIRELHSLPCYAVAHEICSKSVDTFPHSHIFHFLFHLPYRWLSAKLNLVLIDHVR